MTAKILVADDSPTIQKVIGITLASENFEIIKCEDEGSLEGLVAEHKPDLVLLDYNLSESLTGYDLVEKVREIHKSRVIFLYGTFDTIDESLNAQFSIDGSMVKPFDAKKFIHLCRDTIALDQSDEPSASFVGEEIEDEPGEGFDPDATGEIELGSDWQMNQPVRDDSDELQSEDIISHVEKNELEAGMADWGVSVPSVIDQADAGSIDLPPVIEQNFSEDDSEDLVPSDTDLEYPELESYPADSEGIAPQLVPMDELNASDEVIPEEGIELNATAGTSTLEEVEALEEQIADETSIDDDLWSADEVVEDPDAHRFVEETEDSLIDSRRLEDTQPQTTKPINTEMGEKTDPTINPLLTSQFENVNESVRERLDPIIEKVVREEAQKMIERIAWEILPDLAENLIKEQLSRLADDVISEN